MVITLIYLNMNLMARFMGPAWGPYGADRTLVGPMLAPWTLLSGDIPLTGDKCWAPCCLREHHSLALAWWGHLMETFAASLAFRMDNSPVIGLYPKQGPVVWSFDVFFGLCRHSWLSKQSICRWFETLQRSLWRHCNGTSFQPNCVNLHFGLQTRG